MCVCVSLCVLVCVCVSLCVCRMEGLRAADASSLTAAEVLTRLQSDREYGLSEEEVRQRRGTVGWNEFQISQQEPLWRKYMEQVGGWGKVGRVRGVG